MQTNYAALAKTLSDTLGDLRPVAVAYRDAPPDGVRKFEGTVASGCTFWRLASQGPGFYTVPADHFNCPIGSYTHGDQPAAGERLGARENAHADGAASAMCGWKKFRRSPRLSREPACIYYAPLAATVVDPDVVIFAGRPAPLMRLQEAAAAAGAGVQLAAPRASHMHGASRRDRAGRGDEQRLHRQSCLHGPGRRRALSCRAGRAAGRCRGRCPGNPCREHDACGPSPWAPGGAHSLTGGSA